MPYLLHPEGGGSPLPTIYSPSFIVFHITGIICMTWFAQCILYNTYGGRVQVFRLMILAFFQGNLGSLGILLDPIDP